MPLQQKTLFEVVWQPKTGPAESTKVVSQHVLDALKDVIREEHLVENQISYVYINEVGDIWA